jgi:hypothetical protein
MPYGSSFNLSTMIRHLSGECWCVEEQDPAGEPLDRLIDPLMEVGTCLRLAVALSAAPSMSGSNQQVMRINICRMKLPRLNYRTCYPNEVASEAQKPQRRQQSTRSLLVGDQRDRAYAPAVEHDTRPRPQCDPHRSVHRASSRPRSSVALDRWRRLTVCRPPLACPCARLRHRRLLYGKPASCAAVGISSLEYSAINSHCSRRNFPNGQFIN